MVEILVGIVCKIRCLIIHYVPNCCCKFNTTENAKIFFGSPKITKKDSKLLCNALKFTTFGQFQRN